ncbi:luc7-like protein 3 [Babylonia areolata]|uniref:luc7-like protein 3 n=1 Tax=Babylonia areolata TaxID=304850 RepID=UPI003FD5115C
MATNAAAALLDELMGRSRNCDPNEKPPELHWEDDLVCKHFLCGFCPSVLFTNTRADLGICNKIHDEALRKQYQESSRFEKMGYEEEFLQCLQSMISDVEKRIRRGHQRLALSNSQATLNGGALTQREEKIDMLTEKINELITQAEELGNEGKVEEAQGVMKLCDQLKEERTQIQNQPIKDDTPQMKQMEVCEVCGAFLIVDDAPQRQDEHLTGKQHAGYARVRDEIEKRKNQKRAMLDEREQRKQRELEEQERAVLREREERRVKEKERESRDRRDRDRDRDRRHSSRSHGHRSRSRERHRSGSRDRRRSRDRRQRSRSRNDRNKSSKSSRRSRSRSRDQESGSRHKDGDRYRHSKSQSQDRDGEKRHGSIADKDPNSPSGRSNGSGSQSQGDTKTD